MTFYSSSLVTKKHWWQWNTFDQALDHAINLMKNYKNTRHVIIKEEQWDTWYQVIQPFSDQDISDWPVVAVFATLPVREEEPLIYIPEKKTWLEKTLTWLKQKISDGFSQSFTGNTYLTPW